MSWRNGTRSLVRVDNDVPGIMTYKDRHTPIHVSTFGALITEHGSMHFKM
jgi:hypothetical protein